MIKYAILVTLFLISKFLYGATSAENRVDKSYQAAIFTGYDYKVSGVSFMAAKFIKPNDLLGFKGGVANEGDDHQTTFAIQYKKFVENSFYIAPEIYYLNYSELDKSPSLLDYTDERVTALGLGFRIGNQWHWKNFNIGCDWIGVGSNLVHWRRSDDFLSLPFTFTFLNFNAGWSF